MNVNLIYCTVLKVWSRFVRQLGRQAFDHGIRLCEVRFSGEFLLDNGNGCSQAASRARPSVVRYSFTVRGLRLRPCKEGLSCAWNKPSRFGEQLWQTTLSSSWRNPPLAPIFEKLPKNRWVCITANLCPSVRSHKRWI